jgi:hypothetical protein
MAKIFALVVLLVTVIGLAHVIETTARPTTGRQGVRVEGHEH